MRKLCAYALFIWLFLLSINAFAQENVNLVVQGTSIKADVPPQIMNGRTLVPVRIIAENMKAEVKWDDKNKIVTVQRNNTIIKLGINEKNSVVNGKTVTLDAVPVIYKNRTLVPLRFIGESLGVNVGWDDASRTVLVNDSLALYNDDTEVEDEFRAFKVNQEWYVPVVAFAGHFGIKIEPKESQFGLILSLQDKKLDVNISNVINVMKQSGTEGLFIDGKTYISAANLLKYFNINTVIDNKQKSMHLSKSSKASMPTGPIAGSSEDGPRNNPSLPPVESDTSDANGHNDLPAILSIKEEDQQIKINMTKDTAWSNMELADPNRIILDVKDSALSDSFVKKYNAQNGVGVVDDLSFSQMNYVEQVRFSIFSNDPKIIRVVIELAEHKTYDVSSSNNSIIINFGSGRTTDNNDQQTNYDVPVGQKVKIVIDPGHGGSDPGTEGINHYWEKDFTLSMSAKLVNELAKYKAFEIVTTRDDDVYPTLKDRTVLANNVKADMYVSLHANAYTNSTAGGSETFYYKDADKRLGELVHKHLVTATNFTDRGLKKESLYVLRNTSMPAILIEFGFITNENEYDRLTQEAFQQRVIEHIAKGIYEYYIEKYGKK